MTTNGSQELGNLVPGSIIDAVVTIGGEHYGTKEEVTSIDCHPSSDLLHLKTASGNVLVAEATLKFLTRSGWVPGFLLEESQILAGINRDGDIVNDPVIKATTGGDAQNLIMPKILSATVIFAGGTGLIVKSN